MNSKLCLAKKNRAISFSLKGARSFLRSGKALVCGGSSFSWRSSWLRTFLPWQQSSSAGAVRLDCGGRLEGVHLVLMNSGETRWNYLSLKLIKTPFFLSVCKDTCLNNRCIGTLFQSFSCLEPVCTYLHSPAFRRAVEVGSLRIQYDGLQLGYVSWSALKQSAKVAKVLQKRCKESAMWWFIGKTEGLEHFWTRIESKNLFFPMSNASREPLC